MKSTKTIPWREALYFTYGIGVSLWLLLRQLIGERTWWMVLLDHYGALLLFLALPLALVLLLWRRWRLYIPLVLPLLALGWIFGPYWIPRLSLGQPSAPTLSVMTYNVLFTNTNYAAVAHNIRSHQPDLVALQEVSSELMAALKSELGDEYPFAHITHEPSYSTTALLSRHPLDEVYAVDLGAIRPAMVARLQIEGRPVKFISAHLLYYNWWKVKPTDLPAHMLRVASLQNEQARRINQEAVRHADEIVILGCDCNSLDTSETQRILSHRLRNAAKEIGWRLPQPALPALGPFAFPQRIDFVLYRGAVRPLGVYTIYNLAGSDHLPVLAQFEMLE